MIIMNKSRKRKLLYVSTHQLLETYCQGCFIYKHLKNEKGRTAAHKFCITTCTIGEQLKDIGKKILTLK